MAEKRSSIGLKSGEYGGKSSQRIPLVSLSVLKNLKYKRNNTYQDSMRFCISGCLWIRQLSITITELGAGKGCIWSRVRSMNL
jgi:hypothetical protein